MSNPSDRLPTPGLGGFNVRVNDLRRRLSDRVAANRRREGVRQRRPDPMRVAEVIDRDPISGLCRVRLADGSVRLVRETDVTRAGLLRTLGRLEDDPLRAALLRGRSKAKKPYQALFPTASLPPSGELYVLYLRAEGGELVIYANPVTNPSRWIEVKRIGGLCSFQYEWLYYWGDDRIYCEPSWTPIQTRATELIPPDADSQSSWFQLGFEAGGLGPYRYYLAKEIDNGVWPAAWFGSIGGTGATAVESSNSSGAATSSFVSGHLKPWARFDFTQYWFPDNQTFLPPSNHWGWFLRELDLKIRYLPGPNGCLVLKDWDDIQCISLSGDAVDREGTGATDEMPPGLSLTLNDYSGLSRAITSSMYERGWTGIFVQFFDPGENDISPIQLYQPTDFTFRALTRLFSTTADPCYWRDDPRYPRDLNVLQHFWESEWTAIANSRAMTLTWNPNDALAGGADAETTAVITDEMTKAGATLDQDSGIYSLAYTMGNDDWNFASGEYVPLFVTFLPG